jgi:hypothetical protein
LKTKSTNCVRVQVECLDNVIKLALKHGGEYTAGDARDRLNARVLGKGEGY